MKGKILFVAGAAVGYVLGARAGRGAYVKIKDQAVQKGVQQAEGFVKENAPVVAKKAQDVANDAAHAVGSKAKSVSGKGSGATDKVAAKATEAAHKAADKVDEKADDVKKQTSGTSPDDDKLPGVTVGE